MSIKWQHDNLPQREDFEEAQQAAAKGDAVGMLEALSEKMILEGLEIQFTAQFPDVDQKDIHDIIGKATDELYDKIYNGKKILLIGSYLWRTIKNMLIDHVADKKAFSASDIDQLGRRDPEISGELRDHIEEQREESKKKKREQAMAIAESLIPRLGQTNVQNVMIYILGAIKQGVRDIPTQQIADALNLSLVNVRKSKERGFAKLARIVREENLIEESDEFSFIDESEGYVGVLDFEDEEYDTEEYNYAE